MASNRKTIAALVAAIPSVHGNARQMLLDDLLSRLDQEAPEVARISAGLVGAFDPGLSAAITRNFGRYTGGPLNPSTPPEHAVDCLILTIKDNELSGTLAAFNVPESETPESYGGGLKAFHVRRDGIAYAIAMAGTAGNVESAIVLGGLVNALRPHAAVLIGMAAGVRGKVNLGDVVVAEVIHAYEFAVMEPSGPVYMPKPYSVRESRIRTAEMFGTVERQWSTEVMQGAARLANPEPFDDEDDEPLTPLWRPKVKRGGILAGGRLLEDGSLPHLADEIHKRTKAAEMDGAGFAAACEEAGIPWLVIRGIADYGEPDRRKPWQVPATYAAAHYFRSALAKGYLELGLLPEAEAGSARQPANGAADGHT